MKDSITVRPPIVEGLFYPSDPVELNEKIEYLLTKNQTTKVQSSQIIVPHGGWDFTGDYIATAFNTLSQREFTKVIIISNVHREFTDKIILPQSEYFGISDKKIKIDLDTIKSIKKVGKKVITSNIQHMEEHGIECVLPFIKYLYPDAKIVPILLGKTIVSLVRNLSNIINNIWDNKTLIVVSSNFSDFENREFSREAGEKSIQLIKEGKYSQIIEETRTNRLKTCGAGAIASLLLRGQYKNIIVKKEGLAQDTPLSGGKSTYYGAIIFEEQQEIE